jgi:hypothetical protein
MPGFSGSMDAISRMRACDAGGMGAGRKLSTIAADATIAAQQNIASAFMLLSYP